MGRKMAIEAGFGDDGLALGKLAGHDPCHALYALGQNVASLMAEVHFRDERSEGTSGSPAAPRMNTCRAGRR